MLQLIGGFCHCDRCFVLLFVIRINFRRSFLLLLLIVYIIIILIMSQDGVVSLDSVC
jgi:phage shock protein PspC (stress-responsive transcriptional regulator)